MYGNVLLSFVKGSKSAEGGPNALADMDPGGPNPLAIWAGGSISASGYNDNKHLFENTFLKRSVSI